MTRETILKKYPELKELIQWFCYELYRAQRPAHEVILDDEEVMKILKISKRKLQYHKAALEIAYQTLGARSYYFLSDLLQALANNRLEAQNNMRL